MLATAPPPITSNLQQKHLLDNFRQPTNSTKFTDEFGSDMKNANNSELLNLSNSSIANQLLPNTSGGGGGGVPMRLNTLTIGNSSTMKEINRNLHSNNRNHIITDSLPGPESCV